jgi:hypothetical protein
MGESVNRMTRSTSEQPERHRRYSSPETITVEGVPTEPASLTPPGTVTCLVARRSSPLIEDIRSAARRQDYDALRRQAAVIARDTADASRRRVTTFESHDAIPVLTEFRYGNHVLAEGMFPSETLQIAAASVPYGGGPLSEIAFQAVDTFRPPIAADTQHVVVISMPSLTELEQAVLRDTPERAADPSEETELDEAPPARALLKLRMQFRRRR